MKRIVNILIIVLLLLPLRVKAEEIELLKNARNGILIEESTGEILFEKSKDEKVAVASLTKMMVQLIVLEKIENGDIGWNDVVTASKNASGMGGTQIWLSTGEKMSVKDLFKAMSIVSANDATVALAEYISGTEEEFVKLMNKKAKELGLSNTLYKNVTGLDEDGHLSTAYDLAMLARELLKHEDILKISSLYEDYIRKDTPNKYWLVNTNKLVRFYNGADGLKTGFTDNAKYTMAATAKRDNLRLIAIVLGEESGKVRNSEATELLDYGFDNYKLDMIKKKNDIVEYITLDKSDVDRIPIVLQDDLSVLSKKSSPSINYDLEIKLDDIKLPINKNDKVGMMNLVSNGKVIKSSNLIARDEAKKVSFFKYLFNNFINIF
ncbi:MAG: D-alanyl-D-alanine carboxypeptidase [Bacilli bacterium]|nr:D-alanyl-D-alanine carboxypeptidase [Bacilli bacterium]